MRIARGETTVWEGRARIVLHGQEQLWRRLVKPTFEEMGSTDHGKGCAYGLARAQAPRGLEMLDREVVMFVRVGP